MSIWDAVVTPRRLVVYSPRPVDEARAIVQALRGRARRDAPVADDARRQVRRRRGRRGAGLVLRVDEAGPEGGADAEPPRYEFTGTLEGGDDGSLLAGSITTPMTFGVPAAGLTVLLALFLLWGGLAVPLVAIGDRRLDLPDGRRHRQPAGAAPPPGGRDPTAARGRARLTVGPAHAPATLDTRRMPDANGADDRPRRNPRGPPPSTPTGTPTWRSSRSCGSDSRSSSAAAATRPSRGTRAGASCSRGIASTAWWIPAPRSSSCRRSPRGTCTTARRRRPGS